MQHNSALVRTHLLLLHRARTFWSHCSPKIGNQNKQLSYSNATMMTSSNGNIFRVTGPLFGEFTGPGEFPTQRPVTRSFDVFFDVRLNKRLCKQPWGWWFETPSWSLWRQCNVCVVKIANMEDQCARENIPSSKILHTLSVFEHWPCPRLVKIASVLLTCIFGCPRDM